MVISLKIDANNFNPEFSEEERGVIKAAAESLFPFADDVILIVGKRKGDGKTKTTAVMYCQDSFRK